MEEELDQAIRDWKDTLQVANALYQLYKSHRERLDGLESRIKEKIEVTPLNNKDWQALRARIEHEDTRSDQLEGTS